MTDKQTFAAILGGILSAIVGGFLLITLIQLVYGAAGHHMDSGDDGWGFLWITLSVLSGILGLVLSASWARKRFPTTAA